MQYYHLVCYHASSPAFYWKILILAYLAVFQIVGIVLAFQSRKVKFPGLQDSAFIATTIYISSLVLVMLAVDTFILNSYLNAYGAIFAIGILILTSVFLIFTFVPKVICGIVFVAVTLLPVPILIDGASIPGYRGRR